MKRSINSLIGYTISAKDGELGKVNDFFFDDFTWSIRYLVVETGNWLSERKVLIPHAALGGTDWKPQIFHVNLTMEQARKSPDIDTEETVSRQKEVELYDYYGLPMYWENEFYTTPIGMMPFVPIGLIPVAPNNDNKILEADKKPSKQSHGDPHLRSTKNVKGYHISADDGEIGHAEDYIVDDEKWKLCYLVVNTHNWIPGKKVLILLRWIKLINWDESKVIVNLSRELIKKCPEFDASKPISNEYETEFFKHYKEFGNRF
jgi:sporulation protein YlmC with PRC-barrel domain